VHLFAPAECRSTPKFEQLTGEAAVKYTKALPIFSPKAITTLINFIKKERPDLWESWRKLEDSSEEELYLKTVQEIAVLTRSLNMTKTLSEETALLRRLRNILRSELSLPTGKTNFTKEQISRSTDHIKRLRPDLWESWKTYEKNGESFQQIRG
jgi:RNA polymerase-interacting CarD/CdnL/TRCF family regulator